MCPIVFGDFFGNAIMVHTGHDVLGEHAESYHGIVDFILHGLTALPFWLAMMGVAVAYYLYIVRTDIPTKLRQRFNFLYRILDHKYGSLSTSMRHVWRLFQGSPSATTALWRISLIFRSSGQNWMAIEGCFAQRGGVQ